MAWRNPQYCYLHAARDAGVGALSNTGTIETDFPLSHLIDDRMTTLCKWTAAATTHSVTVNRGASGLTAVDRLYIPSHNLNGKNIELLADNDSGFGSATTLLSERTIASADPIDLSFTANQEQYIRLNFPTTSVQPELGQWWLTATVTTTRGPEPDWPDELIPNVETFPGGDAIALDPDQRRLVYSYRRLRSTDLTALEALVAAVSALRPLLVDTAYDAGDGGATLVCKLVGIARARNDSIAPQAEERNKRLELELLEYLQ